VDIAQFELFIMSAMMETQFGFKRILFSRGQARQLGSSRETTPTKNKATVENAQ